VSLSEANLAEKGRLFLDSLAYLQKMVGYVFDFKRGAYLNRVTGRMVSHATVARRISRFGNDYLGANLDALTERLLSGSLSLPEWQERAAREIKDAARISMLIGRGGRGMVSRADWGRMGARLREEYKYLNRFAQEIAAGQLTDAQIRARMQLYAGSVRMFYYDGVQAAKVDAGFLVERRVLHPAEHCEDCVGYAAEGWQPIGHFPPPGLGSRCLHNCQCTKEYSKDLKKLGEPVKPAWARFAPNVYKVFGDTLHVQDLDNPEVRRNLEHLNLLDGHTLGRLKDYGTDIWVQGTAIPGFDGYGYLSNQAPYGWEGSGYTWMNVGGMYDTANKKLLLGTGIHGCSSLALHEAGHAYDVALGNWSAREEYTQLYEQHKGEIHNPYYLQPYGRGAAEVFAETFSISVLGKAGISWAAKSSMAGLNTFIQWMRRAVL